MFRKACIILLIVCICSCHSTKQYSHNGRSYRSYPDCAYMGTFSSVSVIKHSHRSDFNDTLTAYADYIYDSVIRSVMPGLQVMNVAKRLPSQTTGALAKEIARCAFEYENTGDITCLEPLRLVDSVSALSNSRYSSYFVSYANVWSKKQNRKYVAGQTLLISAVVIGIALIVAVEILAASGGGSSSGSLFRGLGNSTGNDVTGPKEYTGGIFCYYMIYDNEAKRFCYLRKAAFKSDRADNDAFSPPRVTSHIDALFNGKAGTIK